MTGVALASAVRAVSVVVLALAPFLFVLGLAPFAYGIWFQSEPLTVGLLGLGAAAGLSLFALDLTGHAVRPVFSRAPVRWLGALIAWSALVSPLQAFPARSWFGTPETGEGIFSFLALVALTALALVLWPYRKARLAVVIAAVGSTTCIGLLNALPVGAGWRPQLLGAYGGALGPAVILIVLGAFRWTGWKLPVVAFLLGLPAVMFSHNKTALLLVCVVGPVAYLALRRKPGWLSPSNWRRLLVIAPLLAVAASAITVSVAMLLPPFNIYAWAPPQRIDPWLRLFSTGATGVDLFYSLHSRGLLALAGLAALASHPLAAVWGFGWGSYNDLLYQHTFLPGVHGFQSGIWNPDWEAVGAGAFHVHSDPLEAVLAGGLVAGTLYLLFVCSIIRAARPTMRPVSAIGWFIVVGQLSEWYPTMLAYPFLALAIAAGCAPLRLAPAPAGRSGSGAGRQAGLLAAATLLAIAAQATAADAVNGGRLLAALNRQDPADLAAFGSPPGDHGRGGIHLWWAALNYAYFIDTQMTQGHLPTAGQAAWYARMLEDVDAWTAQGRASIRLAALTLALRNDLMSMPADSVLAPLRERELANWDAAVLQVIRRAPERTDVAVPDLVWLAAGKHYVPILALCARIFERHPGDRVCQWYGGLAKLTDPLSQAAGLADMQAALASGVEAVAPVAPAAREAVEAQLPSRPQ